MLICHLIATMRGSYNTGAAANLNTGPLSSSCLGVEFECVLEPQNYPSVKLPTRVVFTITFFA